MGKIEKEVNSIYLCGEPTGLTRAATHDRVDLAQAALPSYDEGQR